MKIDGKKIAEDILEEIKDDISKRSDPVRLALVYVAGTKDARHFLEMKKSAGERIGIETRIYELESDISTKEIRSKIVELAKASAVDGIIVELPLPSKINSQYILNAIPEQKDPDVLSQKAQGAFVVGRSKVLPPSVESVRRILSTYSIDLKGIEVTVFGYGFLIGRPIAHWLGTQGATVSVITKDTKNPENFSRNADVIVTGANKSGIVSGDMVKEGVVIIDFGYEKNEGVMRGNVDFESVADKASLITPVPGGVGPIVIACALKNAVTLASEK